MRINLKYSAAAGILAATLSAIGPAAAYASTASAAQGAVAAASAAGARTAASAAGARTAAAGLAEGCEMCAPVVVTNEPPPGPFECGECDHAAAHPAVAGRIVVRPVVARHTAAHPVIVRRMVMRAVAARHRAHAHARAVRHVAVKRTVVKRWVAPKKARHLVLKAPGHPKTKPCPPKPCNCPPPCPPMPCPPVPCPPMPCCSGHHGPMGTPWAPAPDYGGQDTSSSSGVLGLPGL